MTTSTTPITPFLERFLESSLGPLDEPLREIFETGNDFDHSYMQISVLQSAFFKMLVLTANIRSVLEIGTYVGFSAAVFAKSSPLVRSVVTCEVEPNYHQKAKNNFEKHHLLGVVTPLLGDAKSLVRQSPISQSTFDMVFLDGDKEHYDLYVDVALERLNQNGLFVVDNTLFKGEVIGGDSSYSKGIRRLIDRLGQHTQFDMCHVTLGDGMLICRKK
jgi:predicted O-methyltransferase YrrM